MGRFYPGYIDYSILLQIWFLCSILSLLVRCIQVFMGSFNRHIFVISILLGFLSSSLFWITGSYLPLLCTTGIPVPGFYLLSLFLWAGILTFGVVEIRGNLILGSLVISTLIVFLSLSTVLALNFTHIVESIMQAFSRPWLSLSLFLGGVFLVFFWINQGGENNGR